MRTVAEIAGWLEGFAPSRLAESWDNVGLLWGDPNAQVARVMTCLTVTRATASEAVAERANLIVSHHPILFREVKRIRSDLPATAPLWMLARAGIAVASPHTAFDSTAGGINEGLGHRLGLVEMIPLRPLDSPPVFKIVVFTPESDRPAVLAAAFEAGAGRIGAYTECSFATAGQGTFFGTEETNPAVGRKRTAGDGRRAPAGDGLPGNTPGPRPGRDPIPALVRGAGDRRLPPPRSLIPVGIGSHRPVSGAADPRGVCSLCLPITRPRPRPDGRRSPKADPARGDRVRRGRRFPGRCGTGRGRCPPHRRGTVSSRPGGGVTRDRPDPGRSLQHRTPGRRGSCGTNCPRFSGPDRLAKPARARPSAAQFRGANRPTRPSRTACESPAPGWIERTQDQSRLPGSRARKTPGRAPGKEIWSRVVESGGDKSAYRAGMSEQGRGHFFLDLGPPVVSIESSSSSSSTASLEVPLPVRVVGTARYIWCSHWPDQN